MLKQWARRPHLPKFWRHYCSPTKHRDIWICREGLEKLVSVQLSSDHPGAISCVPKNQWTESTGQAPAKDCPWAHQRVPEYSEFKNRTPQELATMISKHLLKILPEGAYWMFHALGTLHLFFS
jgi:hypothetical protein